MISTSGAGDTVAVFSGAETVLVGCAKGVTLALPLLLLLLLVVLLVFILVLLALSSGVGTDSGVDNSDIIDKILMVE